MKRIISLVVAFTVVLGMSSSVVSAAEESEPSLQNTAYVDLAPRASRFFDGYALTVVAEGNRVMRVGFGVYGTGTMSKIGAYSIRIEEEVSPGKWIETSTVYGSSDPTLYYGTNCMDHEGDFTFKGMVNVKYRAVLVAYAKNSSGSEYSDEFTCTGKVCT